MAEGANPDRDVDTINTGHFKRDLAANAAVGLVAGLAQGAAISHTFSLCMQARGYMPGETTAVASAAPPAVPAAPPAPVPTVSAAPLPSEPLPVMAISTSPPEREANCPHGQWTDDLTGPILVCNRYRASYTR